MKIVARGRCWITWAASNFGKKIILLPFSKAPCAATNRPCTWNSGSVCSSTSPSCQCQYSRSTWALAARLAWDSIAPLLRPVVPEVYRIAARSSAWRVDRLEAVGLQGGARQQRTGVPALLRLVQREHVLRARLERDLRHPAEILRRADHHRRLGVADEVFEFGRLVGGIQRQVDIAGAQRRQIEEQRFRRFFDLHRDARILLADSGWPAGWRSSRWRVPGRANCKSGRRGFRCSRRPDLAENLLPAKRTDWRSSMATKRNGKED